MSHSVSHLHLLCFLSVLYVVCWYTVTAKNDQFSDSVSHEEFSLNSKFIPETEENTNNDMPMPVLLWWTDSIFPDRDKKSTSKFSCKIGQCMTTMNKDYLHKHETRGILFYGTKIAPDDLPLPRRSWHEWALFHEESPLNNYILCHQSFIRLFNHTATSRRESDFPLTLQWILNNDYLTERQPLPTAFKNQLKRDESLSPVLYIQSHCDVPSDRDRYVKSLMEHVSIDSYGKCLNNKKINKKFKDPVENLNNPKFFDFIAKYKFHIAFENAYLNDYMTEKLMRTYHVGSVPIYKGAPTAKDWMPSNKSLIFIDDFESPQQLAQYIKQLDENDDDYNAYLRYKEVGITNSLLQKSLDDREWRFNDSSYPNMISAFECHVCDQIHKRLKAEKNREEMPAKFANQSHFGCQQPYTLLVDPDELSKDDQWLNNINWIDYYWKGFDDSLAVNAMLQAKETDSSKFRKYLNKIYEKRRKP